MPRSLQVHELQDLAFQALSKIVDCLGRSLIAVTFVKTQVRALVPPGLANNITKKLLDSLDNAMNKKQEFPEVLEDIVDAILHPRVTALKCNFKNCKLSSVVIARLTTLYKLKELYIEQMSYDDQEIIERSLDVLGKCRVMLMEGEKLAIGSTRLNVLNEKNRRDIT